MSSPSLLSLPAEVRLNIYSHLFDDEHLCIDQQSETSQPKQYRQPALAPILRTCRYLRDEASPSYFSKVKVHFAIRKAVPSTSLIHWLDSIGESNVRLLRDITLRWENYVKIKLELNRNARAVSNDTIASMAAGSLEMGCKGQSKLDNGRASLPFIEMPSIMLGERVLFKAPTFNPTTTTRVGEKHILTLEGVSDAPDRNDYWKANGTAEFCETLQKHLSPRLGATLANRRPYLSSRELVEFVDDASSHAASMRWLWYW